MVLLSAQGAISLDENGEVEVKLKSNEKGRRKDGQGRAKQGSFRGCIALLRLSKLLRNPKNKLFLVM